MRFHHSGQSHFLICADRECPPGTGRGAAGQPRAENLRGLAAGPLLGIDGRGAIAFAPQTGVSQRSSASRLSVRALKLRWQKYASRN